MRSSSKSRSRSKGNRNRSNPGNVVNRVFDSSGPEGKVRGTPQQIIDKYQALARDAQLAGDRVAAENFLQHAEHYVRLLNEAQREIEARREQQEQQRQQRQQEQQRQKEERAAPEAPVADEQPDLPADGVIFPGEEEDEGPALVETPESKSEPKPRRSRRRRAAGEEESTGAAEQQG